MAILLQCFSGPLSSTRQTNRHGHHRFHQPSTAVYHIILPVHIIALASSSTRKRRDQVLSCRVPTRSFHERRGSPYVTLNSTAYRQLNYNAPRCVYHSPEGRRLLVALRNVLLYDYGWPGVCFHDTYEYDARQQLRNWFCSCVSCDSTGDSSDVCGENPSLSTMQDSLLYSHC